MADHLSISLPNRSELRTQRVWWMVRPAVLVPLAFSRLVFREVGSLTREAGALLVSRKRLVFLLAVVLIAVGVFWVAPRDLVWLAAIRASDEMGLSGVLRELAWFMSYWGDFLGFNALLLIGLAIASRMRKSRFLRHLVVISLLGSCFSGLSANVGRASFGRARPSADVAPGFYGPTFRARLHSFPSGHTATAFGASIPVAVACPPVGIPLVLAAGSIAWSRLYNNQHHPTDILASTALSFLFGVPLGLAVRRRRAASLAARSARHDKLHPTGAGNVEP